MSSLKAQSPSELVSNGASHPLTITCVVIANVLVILIIYFIFFFWKCDKGSVGAEAFDDSRSTNSSPCSSPRISRVEANHDLSFLPEFVYETIDREAEKDCAVCIIEFVDGEIGRLLPACGHKFHRDCIDTWFRKHTTCPICRMIVKENKEEGEKICLDV